MANVQESSSPLNPLSGTIPKRVKLDVRLPATWGCHVAMLADALQLIYNIEQHKELEPLKTWTLVSAAHLLGVEIPPGFNFPVLECESMLMVGLDMDFYRSLNLPSDVASRERTLEQVAEKFPGNRYPRILPSPTTSALVCVTHQESVDAVAEAFMCSPSTRFLETALSVYVAVDNLLPAVASILRNFVPAAPRTVRPFISFHKDAPFKQYLKRLPPALHSFLIYLVEHPSPFLTRSTWIRKRPLATSSKNSSAIQE